MAADRPLLASIHAVLSVCHVCDCLVKSSIVWVYLNCLDDPTLWVVNKMETRALTPPSSHTPSTGTLCRTFRERCRFAWLRFDVVRRCKYAKQSPRRLARLPLYASIQEAFGFDIIVTIVCMFR